MPQIIYRNSQDSSFTDFHFHKVSFSLLLSSHQFVRREREEEEEELNPEDMSQKIEKEETEVKVPENLPICIPTTTTTIPPPPSQIPAARSTESSDLKVSDSCDVRTSSAISPDLVSPVEKKQGGLKRPREVTRCSGSGCRKRIGLTGFQCRCGDTFCSEHRYSDRHDCSYDYKAAGREAIARENPVVRAAKLVKV